MSNSKHTDSITVGATVRVYYFGLQPDREFIGEGRVEEICTIPGMNGLVACVRIPGHSGRFLRELPELELVRKAEAA